VCCVIHKIIKFSKNWKLVLKIGPTGYFSKSTPFPGSGSRLKMAELDKLEELFRNGFVLENEYKARKEELQNCIYYLLVVFHFCGNICLM
jgi:hypothetical protein